jgi:hypothetical protein
MKKNNLKLLLLACFCCSALFATAQQNAANSVWKTLAKVTFKKEMDPDLGFKIDVPVFSKDVRMLEGKVIEVRGYVLPTEGYKNQKRFMFSALPYNVCFFCGGAGPETVMEVTSKMPIPVSAEPIILRGTLALNSGDVNKLMYMLMNAEIVH